MEKELQIMTEQMLMVAVLVAIGFAAGKLGVLSDKVLESLSKIISKVLLPALIVTLIPMENGRQELLRSLPVLLASLVIVLLLFGAGQVTGKLCGLKGTTKNIHLICSTFGNMGLMGVPVISAVFGSMGVLYLSLYILIDQTLLWTGGNVYLYKDTEHVQGIHWKKLLNPTTAALLIGLLLLALDFQPGGILFETIESLGDATKPLAMVYLGGTLCGLRLSVLRRKKSIFLLAIVKMLVVPVLVWFLLGLLPGIFSQMTRLVLTMCAGMPTMLTISMMAQEAGSDWEYASQATLFTTLVSIITLPLLSVITSLFV